MLDTPQYADSDIPVPCTVMLTDPVAPPFLTSNPLAAPTQAEITAVALPTLPPTLTDSRKDRRPDLPAWQTTLLSESHSVASQSLPPTMLCCV